MKYSVGIDLGSTTTKAVILGEDAQVLGRGITNSRSNYQVACDVAVTEALISARFGLIGRGLETDGVDPECRAAALQGLELCFRKYQYRTRLAALDGVLRALEASHKDAPASALAWILDTMSSEVDGLFTSGAGRKSDFFRDLAGSRYLALAQEAARSHGVSFDALVGLFDKGILSVENRLLDGESFDFGVRAALAELPDPPPGLAGAVAAAGRVCLKKGASVGTGYGRATLPFPKEQIRSEILCHGLGAHAMFPGTRTVLDIGGQDTKAIQVDARGMVTSFQMNDRCAAGCGRYLGYIADEMNVGVQELGPIACQSNRPVRINSTCTVFAGAELRERLSLGEKREDILAGLHRAIILRAMSLIARSGGITDEFTFTGGVARNPAAIRALSQLVRENYGAVTTNISSDSIYTGALGAALFAWRESAPEAL